MRGFLLLFLVAAATADKLGYNYQPVGHDVAIEGGFAGGLSSGAIGDSSSGSIGVSGGRIANGIGGGFGGFAGGNDAGSFIGTGSSSSGVNSDGGAPIASSEFNKEFYTYSAPEEEFNDNTSSQDFANSLKKNLRVVFIKAPENQALTNAALQLAKQASEDRTAIYVLNKQADISDLANKLQSLKNSNSNKPEVHFVKYRTPEDAARAQQTIQAQYDTLGGPSHNSNEGVAPVLNFASPAAASNGNGGFVGTHSIGGSGLSSTSSSFSNGDYAAPRSTYLPSALRLK